MGEPGAPNAPPAASPPRVRVTCLPRAQVMGLVGEQIDGGDEICGARVVDKSRGRQSIFRLEMWYRDSSKEDVNNTLRDKMIECLNHGDPGKAASNLAFEKVVHNDKKW